MLSAVQEFIKDSFKEGLRGLKFGNNEILVERGRFLIIATVIIGTDMEGISNQIRRCIQDIESLEETYLKVWDGDVNKTEKKLQPFMKKLLTGEYKSRASR